MEFINKIFIRAKEYKKTIVLPESSDIRTIQAAALIQEKEIANVVLVGDEAEIGRLAGNLDISKAKIVNPLRDDRFHEYAAAFYEMRKSKGIDITAAEQTMKNPLYYGAMMVKKGEADGMVAGAVNSTANTLRPALQIIKTAPGVKLVSAFLLW